MAKKKTKPLDEPYVVQAVGRLVICAKSDSVEAPGLTRCMIGGVLIPDITENAQEFELWDVEMTIKVRRKHTGSPMKGAAIDRQLTEALNSPKLWKKKIFDTLEK